MKIDKRIIKLFEEYNYLSQALSEFCKKMNTKYYVNEGGCIWLAYIIAEYLESIEKSYSVVKYYDEYNELFHISLFVDNIIINPAIDEYNGYNKTVKMTSKDLKLENKENEDTRSFFWKQKYKKHILKEFEDLKQILNK